MGWRLQRFTLLSTAALFGLIGGCVGFGNFSPRPSDLPFLADRMPLPHHVPEHPGGLSFRFAMAHDVIHERFPRHGTAWYRERNRITRERLAKLAPDDPASFPLADDLAAGLERLGQSAEAVKVMRDKLARQQAKKLSGLDLYTSYANLGTFLVHAHAQRTLAGDAAARERFREGVELVRKSVKVNPEAHFGRERWQAAIAEFLLAAVDKPALLSEFDCLGNRLNLSVEAMLRSERAWETPSYGRANSADFAQVGFSRFVSNYSEVDARIVDPEEWRRFSKVREFVTKVGAEAGWDKVAVPSHRKPVAFDEPVLGIIGMWRQGGGANPHFALALGETMLRVGQRYIAWAAYERAARLADRYWPDLALRDFLRDHCRKRQARIEESLSHLPEPGTRERPKDRIGPSATPEELAGLRARFDAELAFGESYQRAYQAYEEAKIATGVPITDEHFFDAFLAGREPIASRPGPEEWIVYLPRSELDRYRLEYYLGWGVLGAGLAALAAALLMRLANWPRAGEPKLRVRPIPPG